MVFAGIAVCALLLAATELVLAQEFPTIGAVELVQVSAYGTPAGEQRRDLSFEDPVFGEELVETVRGGALHVRFADDTKFRLGSESRAVLDKFVYDPGHGTGEIALSLGKGFFRYISGKLKGDKVTIRTPTLTLGVRGTVITILVLLDGTSFVSVQEGLGIVTALADSSSMEVSPETTPVRVLPGRSVMPYSGQVNPPGEDLGSQEALDALLGVLPDSPPPTPKSLMTPAPPLPDLQTVSPAVQPTMQSPAVNVPGTSQPGANPPPPGTTAPGGTSGGSSTKP